jgi:hypothetical protein
MLTHAGEAKSFGTAERRDFVEIGSGGKEMRIAGDNQARHRLRRQLLNESGKRSDAGPGKTVRTVRRDQAEKDGIASAREFVQVLFRKVHQRSGDQKIFR